MSSQKNPILENEAFRSYLFYSSILIVKMLVMSFLTGAKRRKYQAYANPEDAILQKVKPKVDDNVERVRRAHLNDIENIPLFFVSGFIYALTNPDAAWATLLFKIYTGARIAHTFVYAIYVVPQPARALLFFAGVLITAYMAAFSNVEDTALHKIKPRIDDNVERVRRAHLNDVENIIPFLVAGFAFLLTNPPEAWANLLFKTFTVARFLHSLVYAIFVVPQPARALCYFVGYTITAYMALKSIIYFM